MRINYTLLSNTADTTEKRHTFKRLGPSTHTNSIYGIFAKLLIQAANFKFRIPEVANKNKLIESIRVQCLHQT